MDPNYKPFDPDQNMFLKVYATIYAIVGIAYFNYINVRKIFDLARLNKIILGADNRRKFFVQK